MRFIIILKLEQNPIIIGNNNHQVTIEQRNKGSFLIL